MKQRFKIIPASYLFLVKNGKVLLLRRANTGYEDGNWSVPAGHLEGDESATQAMVREAKEEVGLTIKAKDLTVCHIMHRRGRPNEGPENERIDFFFVLEKWEGEPQNMETNKCDALEWFSLSNLPENTVDCVKSALNHYIISEIYSEFGWE